MTGIARSDIESFVRDQIAERTGVPASAISGSTVLVEIGLQSIDAVLISGEVEDRFGIEVEPSLMFECETLDQVVSALMALTQA